MSDKRDFKQLDDRLRAERPAPARNLIDAIVSRVSGRQYRHPRASMRLALAGALTVALVSAVAAVGGVGYATGQISNAATAVKNVITGKQGPASATSARNQYGGGPPTIKNFSPSKACVNQVIQVKGKDFNAPPSGIVSVMFGSDAAEFLLSGNNSLYTRVPAGVAAKVQITVAGPNGTATSKKYFKLQTNASKCAPFAKKKQPFPNVG